MRFGNAVAGAITWVSADLVRATTPVGTMGPCDVSVQNWDGGTDTLRGGYVYRAAPLIQGVFPTTSPVGGTLLTIFGANFQDDTQVWLNGNLTPSTSLIEGVKVVDRSAMPNPPAPASHQPSGGSAGATAGAQ